MALILCPNCGHQISDKAVQCPKCGKNPKKNKAKDLKKTIVIVCVVLAIVIVVDILAYLFMQKKTVVQPSTMAHVESYGNVINECVVEEPDVEEVISEDEVPADESVEYIYENEDKFFDDLSYHESVENDVKQVLQSYCDAIANNDFNTLNQVYAPYVERFQSAYNEEKSKVIDRHRKYDETFKVHGKSSHIRWETFEMDIVENGRINAVIVEDYSIDREDKTKYSKFVLEKHFVLNEDYQIVSVWDKQLSRNKE